ncbi:MAG: response regulator [Planctomycetaceae bacterium]|nr:response regulator [Planctomycetaceae bacterium]
MSAPSDSQQPSVLDEIRSTIASLDALRGRKSAPSPVEEGSADRKSPANMVRELLSAAAPAAEQAPPASDPPVAPEPEFADARSSQTSLESTSDRPAPRNRVSAAADTDRSRGDLAPEEPLDLTKPSPITTTACEPVPRGSVLESFLATTTMSSAPQQVSTVEEDLSMLSADSIVVRSANTDAKIMIVDDEPLNVMTFRQHLKGEGYSNFVTTEDATKALPLVRKESPDILLLDIHMPEVSGLDILRVMGLDPALQHIPVLILTASTDPKTRRRALDLGAVDFLSKPIDPNELIPRVRNAIILKKHFDMVANEAARLEQQVERRTRQLEVTRQQLILSLARAAEHRDDDTGNHVIRVGRYAALIAREMGYPETKLPMFEQAAQLHDVGKIGIPDAILFKPGRLDPDQYELMKRHCAIGKQIIEPISEKEFEVLKTHTRKGENLLHVRSSPLLMLAARIAQTHHERWDGTGYPLGLSGTDIPLEGRIVAVADVFDALSSERPYKKALPRERCFEILEEGRGAHFDPDVLDAFFRCSDKIVETQLLLMDEAPTPIMDHSHLELGGGDSGSARTH